MISKDTIQEVTNRLVKTYDPLQIYLFGSYAWGQPTEDSDLDLLIVVKDSKERSYKRPIAGSRALRGLLLSRDIIVLTEKEFDLQQSNDNTSLFSQIKHKGKLLYAKA